MDVGHIAKLANIPLKPGEEEKYLNQFASTIKVIDSLAELDTNNVQPTNQVTGLTNVLREDVIDVSQILSQTTALSQAKQVQDGYFVVPMLIDDSK